MPTEVEAVAAAEAGRLQQPPHPHHPRHHQPSLQQALLGKVKAEVRDMPLPRVTVKNCVKTTSNGVRTDPTVQLHGNAQ